jgi:uncharacterized alkaline shock family protein YloU
MAQQSSDSPSGGDLLARTPGGGEAAGPLQTSKGATKVADNVVTKVAGIAAREVGGVHALGGGASRALGSVTQRVGIGDDRTQGVSVEVGEREAAVDLVVVVEYGESIPTVAQAIRDNVIRRVEGICGLSVTEVNIAVNDLYFPGDDQPEAEEPVRVQ